MVVPEQSRTTRVRALRPSTDRSTIVLVVSGPLARADLAALCERARVLLEGSDADQVVCDVGALIDPDAVAIDALARLQLTARRLGREIQLRHACDELRELLALTGLRDVMPLSESLLLEPAGQTKHGEQALGVEEETDPGDPAV